MSREFNPYDVLIGFGFGIAICMLVLRLSGVIDSEVSVWGQVILVPTVGLAIARQVRQAALAKAGEKVAQGEVR
ncbi:hypothetical protein [Aurantiacibacter flavus]|uniref:Uncharacterized protein n=1 Tax=Aurantiacibacter flavus TaxID=3145232 RepID=A0ABV0CW35_9SPHN